MPRLLIVDDSPVDRQLAAGCLQSIGALEVLEADDGEQALEVMERDRPDLVITDLRMPKLDGLELVQRAGERFPLVPIVVITARGSEKIAAQALLAGAASYVPKSDLAEFLAETVQQVLAVSTVRSERVEALRCRRSCESSFELENDPALIAPLVALLQDELERAGFGDEQVRSRIGTALHEALSNAMIHGNLEVSSELRDDGSEPYRELIEQRRHAEPWASRRVSCRVEQSAQRVRYVIRDQGPGFDRSTRPDPTAPESLLRTQGRGLFLIYNFMDEVEHNETGNEVILTKLA